MQPGLHPNASATGIPNPALVFELFNSYQKTEAMRAAIDLGVFRALGEGPASALELAARCSASERGMRMLCDFLTIMTVLEKHGGEYRHTATSALFLDPRSPACVAKSMNFLCLPDFRRPFENLAEIVKNGRTILPGEGTVEPDNPVWVEFAHSMAPMMGALAGPLGGIVLEGWSGPMDVLDIAAGHGLFGIEIAKQNSAARIVALDWPKVLEVAQANAEKAGVADRFSRLPGSAFEVDYGGPYDAVLLTNFLHHFDPAVNTALMEKVRASLKPGGRAAILEFVPNEDRVTPPMAAAFSLIMLATTKSGDAYTLRELTSMCTDAGFARVTSHPVPMSPHTVVMAYNE